MVVLLFRWFVSKKEKQVMSLYESIAESMYTAVRLGGMPCTGLAWRWGYGWPACN